MDAVTIEKIENEVNINAQVPGSKSIIARAMVLSALSEGKCTITNAILCDDGKAMLQALRDLGFSVSFNEYQKVVRIQGNGGTVPCNRANIYVGSAGTAARFLTAMLSFQDGIFTIHGSAQLQARPMDGLINSLREHGIRVECIEREGHLPICIHGHRPVKNENLSFYVDAKKSTQYVSGLLLALAGIDAEATIVVKNLDRSSYIEMTESMIGFFGGKIESAGGIYKIKPSTYKAMEYFAEPDISSACYLYAIPLLLGGNASVNGVASRSIQGDIKFVHLLKELGAAVSYDERLTVTARRNNMFEGNLTIDMSDYSDQVATMAVLAACRKGVTRIDHVGHIRLQESDRISVIAHNLKACGIECIEGPDFIEITGGTPHGAVIDPAGDHRMAMAFSILGLYSGGMTIQNASCVNKTFEDFFNQLPHA